MIGTYSFLGPEVVLHKQLATTATDVWAFACTLLELYQEKSVWDTKPFDHDPFLYVDEKFLKQNVPNIDRVPSFLKSKLTECFNYDPLARLSAKNVLDSFHKQVFFTGYKHS